MSRTAFAVEMERDLQVPVKSVDTPEAAVKDVDILITASNAVAPLTRPE
jgi:ornithine cyclodeaminase/alanine dehydrogenase-like protein (mu-crystallin family)